MEVEIKLHVLPSVEGGPASLFRRLAVLPALAGVPLGQTRCVEIRDIYYDTGAHVLARAGAGLRLRIEDGRPLVTLKLNRRQEGALTAREEFEEPLTEASLGRMLTLVRDMVGPGPVPFEVFARGEAAGHLIPALVVHTSRLARSLGGQAVLTLDRVEYPRLAAEPYWDIEVESRSGQAGEPFLRKVEQELYQLAGGQLEAAAVNKLERGLHLLTNER